MAEAARINAVVLFCPHCGKQHIDAGKWATFNHSRHLCYACKRFFFTKQANVGVEEVKAPAA